MKTIDQFFQYLGILLLLINACLYLKSYTSKRCIAFKIFTLYLVLTFLILFSSLLLQLNAIHNLFLSHFYFIIQFILLSLFYIQLFNSWQKKYVSGIGILVLSIISIQYISEPIIFYEFNLLEIFLTSFPLIIYSIIHLYNSLSGYGKYMYINAGVLIYLTTSTLIFILGNFLSNLDIQTAENIWFINKVLYVFYLSLILFEWKRVYGK